MLSLRLERIGLDRLPGMNRLYLDLCARPELRARFLGDPGWDLAALRERAGAVRRPVRVLPDLVRQNAGLDAESDAALELMGKPGAVCVVTGQQAGLFGGPAYTLLKALTVVALVRILRAEGIPSAGIFWVASEDHDAAEVGDTVLFAPGSGLQRLRVEAAGDIPWPVAQRRFDAGVEDLVAGAAALLPSGTHAGTVLAWLRESYRPGAGWAEAFRGLLQRVLSPLGLLFFDPMEADRAPLLREFLAPFASTRAELVRSVAGAGDRIRAAGHRPQVDFVPERSFLFFLHPEAGRRRILETSPGRFVVDGTPLAWTGDEWLSILERHAGSFSPDALLRPVFQDWLLPTVAYVGGPAEIAYQAQIRSLYPAWGLAPPLLWPRASATLVSPGAARRAAQLGLDPKDVILRRDEDLLSEILSAQGRLEPLERFRESRPPAETALERLSASLEQAPDDVRRFADSTLGKIRNLLDKLEEHAHRRLKNEQDDARRRFDTLTQEILPEGNLQERTLNLLPLIQAFGPELLTGLAAVLDPFVREHCLIHMEDRE
jgi:bacillithiol biosynthesis cysteine-adding enzyme BshC